MALFIGLMSGTSMDGIDAALVDVSTNTFIAGITCPYSDKTQLQLKHLMEDGFIRPSHLSQMNTQIGREFALAVHELLSMASVKKEPIIAIGSHGQTICHDAFDFIPYTVQLGCPHTIAELTKTTVVADFRTRDIVNGGQGAPFAPIYHQALFGQCGYPIAIVNIGGIANVTFLNDNHVTGYDIGPGNCLMDRWIKQQLNKAYDKDGAWAAQGQVIPRLLTSWLSDPFFSQLAPKSIGKEYFSDNWLQQHLQFSDTAQDVQATLLALTATAISQIILHQKIKPQRLMICGGGAHNIALLDRLREQLKTIPVGSTAEMGVAPDFLEAMMFAWLAEKTLCKTPSHSWCNLCAGIDNVISNKV